MNSDIKHAMTTTFLSDQDLDQVQTILATHGLSGFDASVRLWGRGKAIDVHGTLGQQELSCLLAIARFLGNQSANEQTANDAPPPSLAMGTPAAAGVPAG
ncbi:MAG: hypothetical protein K0Q76_3189 [Panacagrimonas sp.]|jgi:hypothetical protein|nr:hypothetical protein [Panacagrimonas sp.]MCC2658081.1 hypothetical protein [Panacagrimonas sp.]